MQRWMKAALAVTMTAAAAMSQARTDVGVSIEISQPGVFGRVDIGNYPPPQVVVERPIVVMPSRQVVIQPEPVYMWVPDQHRRDWRRYCGQYGACGVPVYFVRDRWYQDNVHQGRGEWRDGRGEGRDNGGDGRWGDRGGDRGDRGDRRHGGHGRGRED